MIYTVNQEVSYQAAQANGLVAFSYASGQVVTDPPPVEDAVLQILVNDGYVTVAADPAPVAPVAAPTTPADPAPTTETVSS